MTVDKVSLGEICKEIYRYPTYYGIEYLDTGVPEVRGELIVEDGTIDLDIQKWRFISETTASKFPRTNLKEGDLVMSVRGTLGKVGIVPRELSGANITANLIRISPDKQKVYERYLWMYMRSPEFLNSLDNESSSTTIKTIKAPNLKALEIPLPSLSEQRRTVAILDRAEALRAKRRAALAQLDELVQSIFIEMFGNLAENPNRWDIKKIGDIAEIKTGGTPSRDIEDYWQNGTLPWVKTTELKEKIIYETEEYISESGFQNSNATLLPQNSILIAMYGQGKTRGRTAKLGIQATTNQACAAILPSEKYETDFLWTFLRLSYDALRNLGRGGNQPNLNLSIIKGFKVYLPPIKNQKEFSKILTSIEKIKQSQQQSLLEINNLFNSLTHEAFTGKLFSHQSFERQMENGGDL